MHCRCIRHTQLSHYGLKMRGGTPRRQICHKVTVPNIGANFAVYGAINGETLCTMPPQDTQYLQAHAVKRPARCCLESSLSLQANDSQYCQPQLHCFVGAYLPTNVLELRSEEHTSELQSRFDLVCRLLLEKKKKKNI